MSNYQLVAVLLLILFAKVQVAQAIVGYQDKAIPASSPAAYNTVSLLKMQRGELKFFCSGSIVTAQDVFTAKHCLLDLEETELFVYFGEDANKIDRNLLVKIKKRQVYGDVDLMISFPSFDFAVLTLEKPIPGWGQDGPAASKFSPIPILTDSEALAHVDEALLAGYGISETAPRFVKGIKRQVNTQIQSYVTNPQYASLVVVQGNLGEGTCHGDSGGPLYVRIDQQWFLAGVASGFDVGLTPRGFKVVDTQKDEREPDCYGGEAIYNFAGDYAHWANSKVSSELLVDEYNQNELPGLTGVKSQEPRKSFADWCQRTDFTDPAWFTVRQLMFFAADNPSPYRSEQVLADCDIASAVVSEMKQVRFLEEDIIGSTAPLASLTKMESLVFIDTVVPDLSPLVDLPALTKVRLQGLGIQSLQEVKGLHSLEHISSLDVTNNAIEDLSSLVEFESLKELKVGRNRIKDIRALAQLQKIEVLEIYSNQVRSLDPILNLSSLREILASDNFLVSPAGEAQWPRLEMAIFSNNELTDLKFLDGSKSIRRIRTYGNPL